MPPPPHYPKLPHLDRPPNRPSRHPPPHCPSLNPPPPLPLPEPPPPMPPPPPPPPKGPSAHFYWGGGSHVHKRGDGPPVIIIHFPPRKTGPTLP